MRNIAVAVATALVFAMVAPAFAQPFADVPTNHWAYDAIAELAAKGLIEGYPDGTFKGDRAMTRYEMAMVVARLLARIESIQIPAPVPPEVRKADLDAIQRLVNEFRAELAALGVRTTAIEEELNAIKARLDNVRITGGLRFREDLARNSYGSGTGLNLTGVSQSVVGGTPNGSGVAFNLGTVGVNASAGTVGAGTAQFLQGAGGATSPFGVNGNPRTSQIDAGNAPVTNRPRYEFKLGFDGSVMPDIHYVIGLLTAGGYQIFNSGQEGIAGTGGLAFGLEGSSSAFGNGAFGEIDSAFLDWRNAWGLPLEIMLGRFGNNAPCGGG
ncbi:MAG TPA: S-layer homology domain-containing protein, partial [bacterium]|nr:S-layer homology domain-containing protein [bacterium]